MASTLIMGPAKVTLPVQSGSQRAIRRDEITCLSSPEIPMKACLPGGEGQDPIGI
jgi:hypothetical protein